MNRYSANLGFLWTDRTLPDAIRAAKTAGFDAVECHWPYDSPVSEVLSALQETELSMLGLNTSRGNVGAGENGLAAIAGREAEAKAAIDEAIEYAVRLGSCNIHVMAGYAKGPTGRATFVENLNYACSKAQSHGITILIEPLNAYDAPGYFLQNTQQAKEIIEELRFTNLKLMFDCYHVGRTEGNVIATLTDLFPIVGHIQFASVPDRGTPDHGEVDYRQVFTKIATLGWEKPIGAEYRPEGNTDDSLSWMSMLD